jgi:exodeoxyribonuclease V gamma subunit
MGAPRAEPGPFLRAPLPDVDAPLVELDDLVRFAEHPVRAFLRQRLGIVLGDFSDEVVDALTVELDNLERYDVGRRLLDARLAGATLDAAVAAERARGLLPPGNLGAPVLEELTPEVEQIAGRALALTDRPARTADVRVATAGGRMLTGTVAGLHGGLLRVAMFARVRAKHRIALYVRWLALTAAHPGESIEAVLVGRARGGPDDRPVVVRLPAIAADEATERLTDLLDLHRQGLREPLPLPCETSAAYVRQGEAAARKAWESEWNYSKEDQEPEHQLVFGGVLDFGGLLGTGFAGLAHRLWDGPLACEDA